MTARGAAAAGAAIVGVALLSLAAYQWATWPDVERLASESPVTTAFIDTWRGRRAAAGEDAAVAWSWVSWDRISVHAKRAVVAAEDLEFFAHDGFSRSEMAAALREALAGERVRGASTITQQLAKNLWLSPSRNPWRKVKEALLTRSLERHLSKRRILELYLNVVEFGPGVYGIEAAARRYFDLPAAALAEHEAAMLAAGLPRPSSWHPGADSRAYDRYVADIEDRMARAQFLWRALGTSAPTTPAPVTLDSLAIPDPDAILLGPDDTAADSAAPPTDSLPGA